MSKAIESGKFLQDSLSELEVHRPVFQWLLAVSFNWSIVSPFLPNITKRSVSDEQGDRRYHRWCWSLWSFLTRCSSLAWLLPYPRTTSDSRDVGSTRAQLKIRLLEAATQLGMQIDLSLSELGTLHDRSLTIGTRISLSEFLRISEQPYFEGCDVEEALKVDADKGNGLILFFVRPLRLRPAIPTRGGAELEEGTGEEYDLWRKYDSRGFTMRFMSRVRDALAETLGAEPTEVDKALRGCEVAVSRHSQSVLDPGCTYVSLLAERTSSYGPSEVLVYDFAKHQVRHS